MSRNRLARPSLAHTNKEKRRYREGDVWLELLSRFWGVIWLGVSAAYVLLFLEGFPSPGTPLSYPV